MQDPVADRIAPTLRPRERVVMKQNWRELLFLHWPVAPELLQPLLPPDLTIDTYNGSAYIGLVPFRMQDVRPVWAPAVPWLSHFPECNVRTYVHRGGASPGVWFFSLDAANPVAVAIARSIWKLPYFLAHMEVSTDAADGSTKYATTRRMPPPLPASSSFRWTPIGLPSPAEPGTLEHFLVERYILYAHAYGRLWRGKVHHTAYPLQAAELEGFSDTSIKAAGIPLKEDTLLHPPLVHYASGVDVDIFPLRPLA
ncbi:MAG: DUF2071 domain-containing protein [Armatimonadota bacterium]